MAMMLAIASTVCKEPVIIDNKECVKKSYPSFWEDFEMLGGKSMGATYKNNIELTILVNPMEKLLVLPLAIFLAVFKLI